MFQNAGKTSSGTCPLLIAGMMVGSGAAVFADTPQSGKYCTSGRGYSEVMFLAQPKPDGSLDFGLLLSTTEGQRFFRCRDGATSWKRLAV
jgi:hypothetical protein